MLTPLPAGRALAALLAAGLLTLTACTSSDSLGDSSADVGSTAESRDSGRAAEGEAPAVDPEGVPVNDAGAPEAVVATATVSFHDPDLTAARREVKEITDRFDGQVADEETESEEGEVAWSRMVLRIPTADFDAAIGALEAVGELDATTRTTEVVTDQVRDNAARIRAQERSLRRLEALVDRAAGLDEIVTLESELSRRQADLDALKATRAHFADRTSLSTITVHAHRQAPEEPAEDEEKAGFLVGLSAGWGGLLATLRVLATMLGALLPWLPVLALVAAPLWWALRRRPHRGTPPQAPVPGGVGQSG